MTRFTSIRALVIGGLVLAACEKNETKPAYSNPTPAPVVDPVPAPPPATRTENTPAGTTDDRSASNERANPSPAAADDQRAAEVKERERSGQSGQQPTAKGGGPAVGSREWARDKMANVRCEHFRGCGDIAKGKKYDTLDSCVTRERANLDKDWKLEKCSRIDDPRLDACIAAVRAKKCDVLFNATPSECSDSKICMDK